MPELKPRANTLNDLAEGARFLFATRPLPIDEAAAALLTGEARALLAPAHAALVALANCDAPSLDAAIREVAEGSGVKLGKLAQPLRAALTGRTTSPGIFDVLALLDRDESLARIADRARHFKPWMPSEAFAQDLLPARRRIGDQHPLFPSVGARRLASALSDGCPRRRRRRRVRLQVRRALVSIFQVNR